MCSPIKFTRPTHCQTHNAPCRKSRILSKTLKTWIKSQQLATHRRFRRPKPFLSSQTQITNEIEQAKFRTKISRNVISPPKNTGFNPERAQMFFLNDQTWSAKSPLISMTNLTMKLDSRNSVPKSLGKKARVPRLTKNQNKTKTTKNKRKNATLDKCGRSL